MLWNKILSLILLLGVALGGFGIGMSLRKDEPQVTPSALNEAQSAERYDLINEAVTTELNKDFLINFKPLRDKLLAIQGEYSQKTFAYFVFLNNAAWTGYKERDLFMAASTIKIPLAMAVMQAIEEDRFDLETSYTIEQLDLDSNFGELYKTANGKDFKVVELLEIMLSQSDNTAMEALLRVMNLAGIDNPFEEVYAAMGWEYNELGVTPNYVNINLKTLSNMYLALYNAKYVNIDHSQMILKWLAESPFKDKLEAGVPEGIVVSHKIGVADMSQTYSDCGIVYIPKRHYLLCLGSEGAKEEIAKEFMAKTSRVVYEFVANSKE